MELIKQIKQAETEAKQIIQQAHKEASELAEKSRKTQAEYLIVAEQERKKAIADAVSASAKAAESDIEKLKQQGEEHKKNMRTRAGQRSDAVVDKIIARLPVK